MKKISVVILFLLSAFFIALSVKNFLAPPIEEADINSSEISYSTVIEKNALDTLNTVLGNKFNRQDGSISAVFFMYSSNCGACFNEVDGYLEVLDQKNSEAKLPIHSIGVFHHSDVNTAQRFKLTTDLYFDNIFALNGEKLIENGLLIFNGNIVQNQLVFFDHHGDLFFKILLPTGITTTKEKKDEVINLVLNTNN